MAKKQSVESSQQERLTRVNAADIKAYRNSSKMEEDSARLEVHLHKHGGEPSAEDLDAMPELTDEQLNRMYRPVKQAITVRIDGDILAWLKAKEGAYQTNLNAELRRAMQRDRRRDKKAQKVAY